MMRLCVTCGDWLDHCSSMNISFLIWSFLILRWIHLKISFGVLLFVMPSTCCHITIGLVAVLHSLLFSLTMTFFSRIPPRVPRWYYHVVDIYLASSCCLRWWSQVVSFPAKPAGLKHHVLFPLICNPFLLYTHPVVVLHPIWTIAIYSWYDRNPLVYSHLHHWHKCYHACPLFFCFLFLQIFR